LKVLLVTGTLAEDTVKRYAKESYIDTETLRLEKAVAALLTPQDMAEALRNTTLESFDFILVPGLVRGDTAVIKEATGIPAFKGPKYAADLGSVLNSLGEIELSTIIPACDLIKEKLHQKALQEIEKVEANRAKLLERPGNMLVGNVAVGKDFPMRVLAEIVDAALMDKRTIQQAAKHFLQAGADLIDVGMIVGESKPQKAKHMVEWVKQVVNVPVSIDTLNPAEIRAAVKAGADLVLSADAGNLDEIAPCLADISVVIIPTNQRMGIFPKKAAERVRKLSPKLEIWE
jgi:dihydropteroate synthase-like protein